MAIQSAVKEVKRIVLSMQLTDIFFDGLLLFTISLLISVIVKLSWYYALIPFIIYIGWNVSGTYLNFSFAFVEERVPELKEMLRTAVDHSDEKNQVLLELFTEVIRRLKHLRTSYFVEFARMTKQILFIFIFCFLVLAVSALQVRFGNISGVLDKGGLFSNGYNLKSLDSLDKGDKEYLYGEEESIAKEGTKDVSIELTSLSNDVDVNKKKSIEDEKFENMYPDDVGAKVTDNYADKIPRKYKNIVKEYFKNIPT